MLSPYEARLRVRVPQVARSGPAEVAPSNPSQPAGRPPSLAGDAEPPAPSPVVEQGARAAEAPPRPANTRPQVLVIDDEEVIRYAVRRWFTRRGWDVLEAANGRVALDMLVARRAEPSSRMAPDVIFCDLRMPAMTGMDLHERLRTERPDLLARIIFSTGDVLSPEVAAFLSRTECPVLEKPFELAVLASTVERVMRMQLCA